MVQFLLGLAAGSMIRSNRRVVGRTLAGFLSKTEGAATFVAHQARRVSAQLSEDYEDLVAEARAEHDSARKPDGL
jgi:hypothetical protein